MTTHAKKFGLKKSLLIFATVAISAALAGFFFLFGDTIEAQLAENSRAGIVERNYYPEFQVKQAPRYPHDCTFIGEYLASFGTNGVSYLEPDTLDQVEHKQVNFIEPSSGRPLEMKSCDYKYDKLLVGSGRAIKYEESDYHQQGSHLYIFHDAASWQESPAEELNFNTCGTYDIIDVSDLGVKIYGFWGHYKDCIFVSCNLFDDIYLIQLGTGNDRFDSGSYHPADQGRYNGSYTVLGHWHQSGQMGKDAAHGGQYYNGSLYLATNNLGLCTIYKCILHSDHTLSFEALNFDVSGEEHLKYRYIDGMCISPDGTLYAQPLLVDASNATNMTEMIVSKID